VYSGFRVLGSLQIESMTKDCDRVKYLFVWLYSLFRRIMAAWLWRTIMYKKEYNVSIELNMSSCTGGLNKERWERKCGNIGGDQSSVLANLKHPANHNLFQRNPATFLFTWKNIFFSELEKLRVVCQSSSHIGRPIHNTSAN